MEGDDYMYLCIQVPIQSGINMVDPLKKNTFDASFIIYRAYPSTIHIWFSFQLLNIILRRIHPSHYPTPSYEGVAADTTNSY